MWSVESCLRHPTEFHFSSLLSKNLEIKVYKITILLGGTKVGRLRAWNKYSSRLRTGC